MDKWETVFLSFVTQSILNSNVKLTSKAMIVPEKFLKIILSQAMGKGTE